jgi:acyl-CoA hydrolase
MPDKTIEATMSVHDLYRSKRCSAADALEHLHDGDFIIVPTGVGEPPTLLTALSEQRRRFHDIKVGQILAVRKFAYFDADTAEHVRHVFSLALHPAPAGLQDGQTSFPAISLKCPV